MKTAFETLSIRTHQRCEMIDLTDQVRRVVATGGLADGIVTVYCPHTTAAVTINENADPDVVHDILLTLEALVPEHRAGYRHAEGNSDAHVKSSLLGPSQQVLVREGRLQLGTWQAVYFCEFDGPRTRRVCIQMLGE